MHLEYSCISISNLTKLLPPVVNEPGFNRSEIDQICQLSVPSSLALGFMAGVTWGGDGEAWPTLLKIFYCLLCQPQD